MQDDQSYSEESNRNDAEESKELVKARRSIGTVTPVAIVQLREAYREDKEDDFILDGEPIRVIKLGGKIKAKYENDVFRTFLISDGTESVYAKHFMKEPSYEDFESGVINELERFTKNVMEGSFVRVFGYVTENPGHMNTNGMNNSIKIISMSLLDCNEEGEQVELINLLISASIISRDHKLKNRRVSLEASEDPNLGQVVLTEKVSTFIELENKTNQEIMESVKGIIQNC